jgi:hypothetical protein
MCVIIQKRKRTESAAQSEEKRLAPNATYSEGNGSKKIRQSKLYSGAPGGWVGSNFKAE